MPPDPTDFGALERAGWAEPQTAQSYARQFAAAADAAVPHLVAAARAAPGQTVLDLCCGHGNVSAGLAATGAQVTGLDFSPAMLALARAAAPGIRFIEGDAADPPFPAATFDAVTIGFGIPHVPDPPAVLAAVRRLLRPGGRIAYSVWSGAGAFGDVFAAIDRHGDARIALPPAPGATDFADPAIAGPALATAGFAEVAFQPVSGAWQVADPGAPFDFFRDGTVRGGALLRRQPAACRAAIRAAVVRAVCARDGAGPRWRIPMPSVVVSATAA